MQDMMIQKIRDYCFMVVAVMMYYFLTEIINLGIFVTFRHAFALLLFGLALMSFMYQPNNNYKKRNPLLEDFIFYNKVLHG